MKGRIVQAGVAALLIAVVLSGCDFVNSLIAQFAPKDEDITLYQFEEVAPKNPEYVLLETTHGTIKILLLNEAVPNASKNFAGLAKENFYKDTFIYGVDHESGALLAGCPEGDGTGSETFLDEPFDVELSLDTYCFTGAVGMLPDIDTDKNDCKFFIVAPQTLTEEDMKNHKAFLAPKVYQKYLEVGGNPELDGFFSIFGQVVEGMDVVEKIMTVELDDKNSPVVPIQFLSCEYIGPEEWKD